MLTVHHLGKSQSERIVWLCEELEVPYALKRYTRDPQTMLSPPELRALHPIGSAPVITDGPHPETSDLVAGWWMIDVDSHERAVELAAYVSSEPGPGGEPLSEWIDVRGVMADSPSEA